MFCAFFLISVDIVTEIGIEEKIVITIVGNLYFFNACFLDGLDFIIRSGSTKRPRNKP